MCPHGFLEPIEHYEIARYDTLKTWAAEFGLNEAEQLLEATLAAHASQ